MYILLYLCTSSFVCWWFINLPPSLIFNSLTQKSHTLLIFCKPVIYIYYLFTFCFVIYDSVLCLMFIEPLCLSSTTKINQLTKERKDVVRLSKGWQQLELAPEFIVTWCICPFPRRNNVFHHLCTFLYLVVSHVWLFIFIY